MKSLTSTNAVTALKGDKNTRYLNISQQRLSKFNSEMDNATPWVGHYGRVC